MRKDKQAPHAAGAEEVQPLLDLAKQTYRETLTSHHHHAAASRIDAWASRPVRGHRAVWPFAGAALAVLTALAVVALPMLSNDRLETQVHAPVSPALTFSVQGGALAEGGYLRATGRGAVAALFSDGTNVVFEPGARGRVLGTTAVGGRLSLEQGVADVRVHRLPAAAWTVNAGPYAVEVTGTEFLVRWSPIEEQFELRLRKGSVAVRGPFAERGIDLVAGQRLLIAVPAGRITLEPDAGPETERASAGPRSGQLPRPRDRGDAKHKSVPVPSSLPAPAEAASSMSSSLPSWSARVAAGDFDAVLREAQARGLERVLQQGSLAELTALADAARYGRKVALAKAALQSQRQRFSHAPQAREATFFLARLAEDERDLAQAAQLYDQYLSGTNAGLYAGEALGRKMLLEQRQGNPKRARALAQRYLSEHADGSYATPARKLLGNL